LILLSSSQTPRDILPTTQSASYLREKRTMATEPLINKLQIHE